MFIFSIRVTQKPNSLHETQIELTLQAFNFKTVINLLLNVYNKCIISETIY